jgi:cysteine-rich repeat protein
VSRAWPLIAIGLLVALLTWGCPGDGSDIITGMNCGNGVLDPGEQCDDGNNLDGDGCSADCLLPSCGDGILDAGEACDDGNNIDGDGCDADCSIDRGNLAWIQANVFGVICNECHFPGGPGPMPLDTEEAAFQNLVDVLSVERPPLDRVEPGDPENSYLVHKIEGRSTIAGSRMPPPPRPMLSTEQIDAIIEWIERGAPR